MRLIKLTEAILAAAVITFSASSALAEEFFARLNGFQELGAQNAESGAILSNATGTLRLELDKSSGMATFTLDYSDVGTTAPKTGTVTQAHIHFGKVHSTGGILVFFCANVTTAPAGTQACPQNTGTVTGTFKDTDVQAITGQNVSAGDFDALEDALNSNTAYANIHTTAFPAGEIRGQIRKVHRDDRENSHRDR